MITIMATKEGGEREREKDLDGWRWEGGGEGGVGGAKLKGETMKGILLRAVRGEERGEEEVMERGRGEEEGGERG